MNMSRENQHHPIQEIMATYEQPLLRYVNGIVHNPETARDVVQESFIRFCTGSAGKTVTHPSAWLYKTARNLAIDSRRKHRNTIPLEELPPTAEPAAAAPTPAGLAIARDDARRLRQLMPQLPAREQEILRLRYQAGFSYQKIAGIMGLSVSNVGFILNQALNRLKKMVQDDSVAAMKGGTL